MDKKKYTVHFSNEYGKLKQMNIRQKIGCIWDYYKVYFFLLMLAALVVFYIADALHQRSREIVLQGFFPMMIITFLMQGPLLKILVNT